MHSCLSYGVRWFPPRQQLVDPATPVPRGVTTAKIGSNQVFFRTTVPSWCAYSATEMYISCNFIAFLHSLLRTDLARPKLHCIFSDISKIVATHTRCNVAAMKCEFSAQRGAALLRFVMNSCRAALRQITHTRMATHGWRLI